MFSDNKTETANAASCSSMQKTSLVINPGDSPVQQMCAFNKKSDKTIGEIIHISSLGKMTEERSVIRYFSHFTTLYYETITTGLIGGRKEGSCL